MPYWMTNPEHGVMPVYSASEVEQAKVHGWSLLNEGDSPLRIKIGNFSEAKVGVPIAEVTFSQAPARKKPGPKPKAK